MAIPGIPIPNPPDIEPTGTGPPDKAPKPPKMQLGFQDMAYLNIYISKIR